MSSTTLPRPARPPLGVRAPVAAPSPLVAARPAVPARTAEAAAKPGNQTRAPTAADAAVGLRIRALRRAARQTQKELAFHIGVTNAQLHRYEAGISRVAASRLVAIARALNCRVEDLVNDHAPEAFAVEGPGAEEFAELARAFMAITDPKHRAALVSLANTMAGALSGSMTGAD